MLRAIVLVTATSFAFAGCYMHGSTEPVGYAEVTSAPPNIETYPSTSYEGRPVYLYQERWYYRDGARWNYYREEPSPLYEHRTRVIAPSQPKRGPEERKEHDDHKEHKEHKEHEDHDRPERR